MRISDWSSDVCSSDLKFPDQNLAESLQRIPGISIQRDAGEGRAITVRGLGAQFTRVRLNGMETIATSTDGAAANRDRAFDFNVFASELLTSLVVRSDEHTSEPQSLLRISFAVFCLKTTIHTHDITTILDHYE